MILHTSNFLSNTEVFLYYTRNVMSVPIPGNVLISHNNLVDIQTGVKNKTSRSMLNNEFYFVTP